MGSKPMVMHGYIYIHIHGAPSQWPKIHGHIRGVMSPLQMEIVELWSLTKLTGDEALFVGVMLLPTQHQVMKC